MEWLVIDAVYLRTTGAYALILHASSLKMMAEVSSEAPIQAGDILYPVRDAIYLINEYENQRLKVTNALALSAPHWRFLKRLYKNRAATLFHRV